MSRKELPLPVFAPIGAGMLEFGYYKQVTGTDCHLLCMPFESEIIVMQSHGQGSLWEPCRQRAGSRKVSALHSVRTPKSISFSASMPKPFLFLVQEYGWALEISG